MSCKPTVFRAGAGVWRSTVSAYRPSLPRLSRSVIRSKHIAEDQTYLRSDVHAAASADAVSGSGSSRGRKYSVLHDFCMQIPYGFFIVLSGIVLGIRGPVAAGILLGFVGMAVLLCARASVSAWKLGRPSTAYTVMSTMATSYLTWVFGLKFKMMVTKADAWGPLLFTPPFLLLLLSVAITIFQIYNVWAGGNPPKAPKSSQ